MRVWKIKRISTFDDDELAAFITNIDNQPGCKFQEVIFMGNNSLNVRIYQILYTEE